MCVGWRADGIYAGYLLSKIEQRLGSPEKPLSSLGALGYKNYWTLAVMRFLEHAPDDVRLEGAHRNFVPAQLLMTTAEISSATSMTLEDVCATLMQQNMIHIRDATPPPVRPSPGQSIRYPKGRKNGGGGSAMRRHPPRTASMAALHAATPDGNGGAFVPPAHYEIRFERARAAAYMRAWEAKGYLRLKPERLQWTPYLVARTAAEQLAGRVEAANGHVPVVVPWGGARVVEPPATPATPMVVDTPGEMVVDSPEPEPEPEPVTPGPRRTRSGQVAEATPRRGRRPKMAVEDAREPNPECEPEEEGRRLRSGRTDAKRPGSAREPSGRKRRRVGSTPESMAEGVKEEFVYQGAVHAESDLRSTLVESGSEDAEGSVDEEYVA